MEGVRGDIEPPPPEVGDLAPRSQRMRRPPETFLFLVYGRRHLRSQMVDNGVGLLTTTSKLAAHTNKLQIPFS